MTSRSDPRRPAAVARIEADPDFRELMAMSPEELAAEAREERAVIRGPVGVPPRGGRRRPA